MDTLGLSSTPQKSDNMLQRLFWPSIQNQYDVNLVGQQGFWLCVVIGCLSGLILIATGQIAIGIAMAFIFLTGACGVRERSVPAASVIFTIYFLNVASGFLLARTGNPLISLVCLMLLLANVRASAVSRHWLAGPLETGDTNLPERSTESFGDRFSNQMAILIWPKVRVVFFVVSAVMILLMLVGTAALLSRKKAAVPASNDGTTLTISPSH